MKYQFYAIVFDVAGNQVSSKSASSPLTITTATQLVTSVSLSPNSAQTKNIGETFTITPTVGPSNANNKNVNWISSNTNVATVSKASTASGTAITVTCKAAGTANITATAADGSGKSASLSLTVINPVTSLSLNKDQTTIQKSGASTTVTATVTPSSYTNVEWSISNTTIATITPNGTTCTIKPTSTTGTATLTAKAGSKTATCTVNVVNFVTTTYSYTGTVQQVDLPAGTYKLECWGAEGSNGNWDGNSIGGYGGYSVGIISINSSTTIFICIGGKGNFTTAGYNGGGQGKGDSTYGGAGGGATHIGYKNTLLSNYLSDYTSNLLVVAGGGGGGGYGFNRGGSGGGIVGGNGQNGGTGGTQTSVTLNTHYPAYGHCNAGFGKGGNGASSSANNTGCVAGGGSGLYGGSIGPDAGAGGGSGYINTTKLTNAFMYGYNVSTSNGTSTKTYSTTNVSETPTSNYAKLGHGAAKITPVN